MQGPQQPLDRNVCRHLHLLLPYYYKPQNTHKDFSFKKQRLSSSRMQWPLENPSNGFCHSSTSGLNYCLCTTPRNTNTESSTGKSDERLNCTICFHGFKAEDEMLILNSHPVLISDSSLSFRHKPHRRTQQCFGVEEEHRQNSRENKQATFIPLKPPKTSKRSCISQSPCPLDCHFSVVFFFVTRRDKTALIPNAE